MIVYGLLALAACTPEDESLRQRIVALRATQTELTATTAELRAREVDLALGVATLEAKQRDLQADTRVLTALAEGTAVQYILRVSLRQVHYSLDIAKQMKDAMNEVTFDLVTDRTTYERAQVGDDLVSAFRGGSAIMEGSWGGWRIKIEDKRRVVAGSP